jgi:polyhydroxyalkanoate synthesis repressor PhaR
MLVIKRYPNRKLYDTEAKRYCTLAGVAALIREGREIQVIDHTTGEDLTTLVLTQIIVEQERTRSGFLPAEVLTGLIQAGGHTLSTLRHSLAAPLHLMRQVDDEIGRRIQNLVDRGKVGDEEGRHLSELLLSRPAPPPEVSRPTTADLQRVLARLGLPSRDDIQQVQAQLDRLEKELARMEGGRESE